MQKNFTQARSSYSCQQNALNALTVEPSYLGWGVGNKTTKPFYCQTGSQQKISLV